MKGREIRSKRKDDKKETRQEEVIKRRKKEELELSSNQRKSTIHDI